MAAGLLATPAKAAEAASIKAENVVMQRTDNTLTVNMDMVLSKLKVPTNRAVVITPCLVNAGDTTELKSIGIYGRRRYYYYLRNDESWLGNDKLTYYRASEMPQSIAYSDATTYADWMSGSTLGFKTHEYGCCNGLIEEDWAALGTYYKEVEPFVPELIYVTPEAQREKQVVYNGKAYVQFPVNQTVIYADYRDNTREIGKICSLIDTLKSEGDVVINRVTLKGYASPEGPYDNNTRLAKGRVEALKTYVKNLYNFAPNVITTDYEPEDWDGFRTFVENSSMTNRAALLGIINGSQQPDAKEATLRRDYPDDFAFLLQQCFPALRHTDYTISCDVKHYVDPVEIKRVLATHPRNLSLDEIYVLANTYESGSDEFNELYETAVRLYPNDPIANLNVANNAIRRGDYEKATEYLNKAGDSAEANYTRGVVAYLTGDTDSAKPLLHSAAAAGVTAADLLLDQIK
jgi:tetratricopeptide (TPR) repeat protein